MELDRLVLNFIWKNKHERICRKTLKVKNKNNNNKKIQGKLGIPDIKTYQKAFIIKQWVMSTWIDDRPVEKSRNRTKYI